MAMALVALAVLVGCGDRQSAAPATPTAPGAAGAPAPTERLPLSIRAPDRTRLTMVAARPVPGDDVPASWCLHLQYPPDVHIVGGEQEHEERVPVGECGRKPAPPVSGWVSIACDKGYVAIYGAIRDTSTRVWIAAPGEDGVQARYANLPPRSGFRGRSYLVAAPLRPHTAFRTSRSARPLFTVPRGPRVCPREIRGTNARPFATFP